MAKKAKMAKKIKKEKGWKGQKGHEGALTLTVPTYFLMLVYQGGVLFATPQENHAFM